MRQGWRTFGLSALIGVAALGVLVLVGVVLTPLIPRINPDVLIGSTAVLAALAGALAVAWQGGPGIGRRLFGAAAAAGIFLLALGGIQAYIGTTMGSAYHPSLEAEIPMNGTWAPSAAAEALEAQGYEVVAADPAGVDAVRSEAGIETQVRLRPSAGSAAGPNGTDVVMTTRNSPTGGLGSSTAASAWMETHRDQADERLAVLVVAMQVGPGWEPVAPPTYEKHLAVE